MGKPASQLQKNVKTIPSAKTKITITRDTLKPAKEKYQDSVDLRETVPALTYFLPVQIKLKVMTGLT